MSLSYNSDKEFITLMFPDEQECENIKETIDLLRDDLLSNPDDKNIRFQLAAAEVSHESWMLITEGVQILENLTAEEVDRKISGWKARNAQIWNNESNDSKLTTTANINGDISKYINNEDYKWSNKDEQHTNVIDKASYVELEENWAMNNTQETQSTVFSISTEEVTPLLVQDVCISCASAPPPEELYEQESSVKNARKDEESMPQQQKHLQNIKENCESTESTVVQSSLNTEWSDWNIYSQLSERESNREDYVKNVTVDKCDSKEGKDNDNNINNDNNNTDDDDDDSKKSLDEQESKKCNGCESDIINDNEECDNSSGNSFSSLWFELISTKDKMSIKHTPSPSVCSDNTDDNNNDNNNSNKNKTTEELESQINKEKITEQIIEMERCLSSKDDDSDTIAPSEMSDLGFYYYYLTVGYSKLNEREKARVYLEEALKLAPKSRKVMTLKEYICGKDEPIIKKQAETKREIITPVTKSLPTKKHEDNEQKQCESNIDKTKSFVSNHKLLVAGSIIGGLGIGALLYYLLGGKKNKHASVLEKVSQVAENINKT